MTRNDKKPTVLAIYAGGLISLFSFFLVGKAQALQVTLAWDESPPQHRISFYRLYYGNCSGDYTFRQRVSSRQCLGGVCKYTLDLYQGRWYFAVTAVNLDGLESGYSQEVFADLYADPRLIYPNGAGITWARGCVYEIRWAGFDSSHVSLELVSPSGSITLGSSTPNHGSFLLRMGKKFPAGEGYIIRVQGRQLPQEQAQSQESFAILEPQVVAPGEGSVFPRGEDLPISWTPEGFCGEWVSVALHKGSRRIRLIGANVPNTGQLLWPLPQELKPGSGYKIVVRSTSHGACRASSQGGFVIQ